MNANDDNSQDIAIGALLAPTIIFISLKLSKTIDWNWFWVFTPIWSVVALFLFFALVGLIFEFFTKKK